MNESIKFITKNSGNCSADRQELINHYEVLRTSVLASNEHSTITGFSVVILRGMTSWIKTYLSLESKPITLPEVNLETTNKLVGSSCALQPPSSLPQIQKEVTMILTNMILFNQLHKKEECHHA